MVRPMSKDGPLTHSTNFGWAVNTSVLYGKKEVWTAHQPAWMSQSSTRLQQNNVGLESDDCSLWLHQNLHDTTRRRTAKSRHRCYYSSRLREGWDSAALCQQGFGWAGGSTLTQPADWWRVRVCVPSKAPAPKKKKNVCIHMVCQQRLVMTVSHFFDPLPVLFIHTYILSSPNSLPPLLCTAALA